MEYLMTYGWAILIVIIVAAALYALGIFNPATYTGRIPTGFTTLGAPTDWELLDDGNFTIILSNRLPQEISVTEVRATYGGDTGTYAPDFTIGSGSTQSITFNTGGTYTAGSTYSVDVAIDYSTPGGLVHTETGTVTGTVSAA